VRFLRVTIVAFALVVLSTPGSAQAAHATPIDMSGTVTSTPAPEPACDGLRNSDDGYLSGSPLDRARWKNSECIDLINAPGSFYVRNASFTLTARTGSLSGTYTARGGPPNSHLHVYVWGRFQITKGTGAYRKATGSGVLAADVDLPTSAVDLQLVGTLRSRES
jgi:hypothetical protein